MNNPKGFYESDKGKLYNQYSELYFFTFKRVQQFDPIGSHAQEMWVKCFH